MLGVRGIDGEQGQGVVARVGDKEVVFRYHYRVLRNTEGPRNSPAAG